MVRKCQEIIRDGQEMVQDGQEMVQDGQKMVGECQDNILRIWSKIVGNGPGWSEMVQDDPRFQNICLKR